MTSPQRQIDATDRQIDALVYALYDLTAEAIAIVEGADGVVGLIRDAGGVPWHDCCT